MQIVFNFTCVFQFNAIFLYLDRIQYYSSYWYYVSALALLNMVLYIRVLAVIFMQIPFTIRDRVAHAIEFAWQIVLNKAGKGEIRVNKEASLQLYYSSILKDTLDLFKFSSDEQFYIELEVSVKPMGKPLIIDVLISYSNRELSEKHAIELKCYKTKASSGNKRGAVDIFMKDVYMDLYYTEQYVLGKVADFTTCLVLTDFKNFISPKKKTAKSWAYDISDNFKVDKGKFSTPIGGKNIEFQLGKSYHFHWVNHDKYWGAMLRPMK